MEVTEEQAAELQEKMNKMSPEELKEFSKQNCIFCQMVDGKVQTKKIHEDEHTLAILDINPANPGHMLVLPKEHYHIMPQAPESALSHLALVVKELSLKLLKALNAGGTQVFIANGTVAGQKAQHFMIHLIPRMANDGVTLALPEVEEAPMEELQKVKKQLFGQEEEGAGGEDGEEKPSLDAVQAVLGEKPGEAEIVEEVSEPKGSDDAQKAEPSDETEEKKPSIEEALGEEAEDDEDEDDEEDDEDDEEDEDEGDDDDDSQKASEESRAVDLDDVGRLLGG